MDEARAIQLRAHRAKFVESNSVQIYQQLSGLCDLYQTDRSDTNSLDQNAVYQALGLIENRSATTCLPPSPLRNSFTQPPNVFGYNYPQSTALEQSHQLLQRLQSLSGYTPPNLSPFSASYPPTPPLIQYPYAPPMYSAPNLNSAYTLQPPPQKKLPPSPLALRHPQFSGSPVLDRRPSPIKLEPEEKKHTPPACEKTENIETHFIKPLSQVGTLTATDNEGRVRVIVPVPSGAEDAGDLLRALRMSDDFSKGASSSAITRSTSEKVPNRSELMSQVQRTAWARHTTK